METPLDDIFIDELLAKAVDLGACELVLESETMPRFRRRGENELIELSYETPRFAVLQRLIYDILLDDQIRDLENDASPMFVYNAANIAYFGVFVTFSKSQIAATFHLLPPQ